MPFKFKFHHSDVHSAKFKKNLAVAAAIVGFMAIIWIVTMIRIGAGT